MHSFFQALTCCQHTKSAAGNLSAIGTYDRGVRVRKDLAVLRDTDMPAVLVETAFIDNIFDVQCLLHCTDDFAKAIALGITDYVAEVSHE